MKPAVFFSLLSLVFCGCVSTSTDLDRTQPISVAKKAVAQHEQWAYDGDYKVTPLTVNGKTAGWKVSARRINDPKLPATNKARYDNAGPVVITLDENGNVVSYSSPYRKQ